MKTNWKQLQRAFVEDHRTLTRGYARLLNMLDEHNFADAAKEAKQLDELAGPHIAFEETFLYLKVGESRGEEYTGKLYEEHSEILGALLQIRELAPDADLTDVQIADLKERLHHGLDHAAACGSLLSHLKGMREQEQGKALQKLIEFRENGRPWSQLPGYKKD